MYGRVTFVQKKQLWMLVSLYTIQPLTFPLQKNTTEVATTTSLGKPVRIQALAWHRDSVFSLWPIKLNQRLEASEGQEWRALPFRVVLDYLANCFSPHFLCEYSPMGQSSFLSPYRAHSYHPSMRILCEDDGWHSEVVHVTGVLVIPCVPS